MRRVALDLWTELAVRAFLILRRWDLGLAHGWWRVSRIEAAARRSLELGKFSA
jgi:hypothetical protein